MHNLAMQKRNEISNAKKYSVIKSKKKPFKFIFS